ncbi:MAG: sugar phosphate nucleotidyltransferase [Brevinema sp.]
MKIVLPLAGKGTRLLPHTKDIPKPLMFVAGQSILDYLIEKLIPLNPSEFVFITGYLKEQIEGHLKQKYPNLPMQFIEQENPQGLGHAIYQARDAFSKDEDLLVILGDQTFTINWENMLENSHNRIAVAEVNNPSSFGIVNIDDHGFVTYMEEKPEHPKSNLAITGTYYFPSAQSVFSALAYQITKNIRTRGEIQITDSMRIMMELGEKFETIQISDWNDCGNHADLLKANKTLLQQNPSQFPYFDDSVIIHQPVWIHPSSIVTNSTIGPNTTIAESTQISNSQISNTIINSDCTLENCNFQDSYLGKNISLKNHQGSQEYLA